jgi:murein endopeptidase
MRLNEFNVNEVAEYKVLSIDPSNPIAAQVSAFNMSADPAQQLNGSVYIGRVVAINGIHAAPAATQPESQSPVSETNSFRPPTYRVQILDDQPLSAPIEVSRETADSPSFQEAIRLIEEFEVIHGLSDGIRPMEGDMVYVGFRQPNAPDGRRGGYVLGIHTSTGPLQYGTTSAAAAHRTGKQHVPSSQASSTPAPTPASSAPPLYSTGELWVQLQPSEGIRIRTPRWAYTVQPVAEKFKKIGSDYSLSALGAGGSTILIGDISKDGGKMPRDEEGKPKHKSHKIGIDADIGYPWKSSKSFFVDNGQSGAGKSIESFKNYGSRNMNWLNLFNIINILAKHDAKMIFINPTVANYTAHGDFRERHKGKSLKQVYGGIIRPKTYYDYNHFHVRFSGELYTDAQAAAKIHITEGPGT